LVGISAITGTAPRSYELSAELRKRGIPVVLGGVHPTLVPEEAVRHADSTVVGYAEESWPQLLRDFVAGRLKRRYDQSPNLKLANLPFPQRRNCIDSRLFNVATPLKQRADAFTNVISAWFPQPGASPCRSPLPTLSPT
jgi:radical SAM superfamily enzyme YgiQ (UPF0313 family)